MIRPTIYSPNSTPRFGRTETSVHARGASNPGGDRHLEDQHLDIGVQ